MSLYTLFLYILHYLSLYISLCIHLFPLNNFLEVQFTVKVINDLRLLTLLNYLPISCEVSVQMNAWGLEKSINLPKVVKLLNGRTYDWPTPKPVPIVTHMASIWLTDLVMTSELSDVLSPWVHRCPRRLQFGAQDLFDEHSCVLSVISKIFLPLWFCFLNNQGQLRTC